MTLGILIAVKIQPHSLKTAPVVWWKWWPNALP